MYTVRLHLNAFTEKSSVSGCLTNLKVPSRYQVFALTNCCGWASVAKTRCCLLPAWTYKIFWQAFFIKFKLQVNWVFGAAGEAAAPKIGQMLRGRSMMMMTMMIPSNIVFFAFIRLGMSKNKFVCLFVSHSISQCKNNIVNHGALQRFWVVCILI